MREFILLVLFNVSMAINYIVKYMIMYLFDFYKYGIDNRNIFFLLVWLLLLQKNIFNI